LFLFLSLSFPSAASAQAVSVTPSALFLDQRERSERLTLLNRGDRPAEVEVSFAFGYAQSDSVGNITVPLADSASVEDPSLIPYLRAFPRRLRLAPGQRSTVRILAQPPQDLPDGEYWARVLVSSVGAEAPVEQRYGASRVLFNIRTTIAVATNYRHGRVHTSLNVDQVEAKPTGSGVRLLLDLARGGNAAWLGQVQAQVVDGRGEILGETLEKVAVYRPLRWGVDIPLQEPLAEGSYSVRYVLSAVRPDEASEDIIDAPPVQGTVPVG
jgi:hypothetical protein